MPSGSPTDHDGPDLAGVHARQAQVVARREADDAAGAAFALRRSRPSRTDADGRSGRRAAKSLVNTKVESYAGFRSPFAARCRAQVAGWVVQRKIRRRRGLLAAEPRSAGPFSRNQQPLVREGVVSRWAATGAQLRAGPCSSLPPSLREPTRQAGRAQSLGPREPCAVCGRALSQRSDAAWPARVSGCPQTARAPPPFLAQLARDPIVSG